MGEKNYLMLEEETENTYKFAFFDCSDNLYKDIFLKRGITALITDVFTKGNNVYKMMLCDVEKKDAIKFCKAMKDLVEVMNEKGHVDYARFCKDFFGIAIRAYR